MNNESDRDLNRIGAARRNKRLLTVLLAVVTVGLFVAIPSAVAVHDEATGIQLDGDIAQATPGQCGLTGAFPLPSPPCYSLATQSDWNSLFQPGLTTDSAGTAGTPGGVPKALPAGFLKSSFSKDFVSGAFGPDNSTFATGSKSIMNPSGGGVDNNAAWQCNQDNNVGDKVDIVNLYGALYRNNGDKFFYFAMERAATEGTAHAGFWFLKDGTVGCSSTGAAVTFTGNHVDGDVYVVVDYTGGGRVSNVEAFQWSGGANGCIDSAPGGPACDRLPIFSGTDCKIIAGGDSGCATVNGNPNDTSNKPAGFPITPPWASEDKDGDSILQTPQFLEGGINLTVLGLDVGCFSGFLGATRSADGLTADLKDYALGALAVCDLTVDKTGDTLGKIGDPVDYTITIHNTGSTTLFKRTINDTLLGAIATNGVNVNPNGYVQSNTCDASLTGDDLLPGGTDECTITLTRTVLAGDPDPLPNTVNILYTENADGTGAQLTRSDDHSVNLFQPAVQIVKEGDGLSKATDPAHYTFTITNMSSQDSPNLTLASIVDNVIGDLSAQATAAGCDVLTYQEACSFSLDRTVLGTDPDPLVNTVDVLYHPVGFPNDIAASDGHSVNLFQPKVSIEKTGNALSKIGDNVTYHFKITNTGSADSPNLILDSISDDVLGDLADEAPAACDSIAPGASCEFDVPWTVAAVDIHPADGQSDDPVINTVTIHFHPDGFPNDITATGSHELNLFQPSIGFGKTADTALSKVTDDVNYTIALNNTSSPDTPDLTCTITDAKLGINKTVTLASGNGDVTNVAYTVQAGDPDPLVNNASVSCSPDGFPNVLSASDSWTVNLFQPGVTIEKTGDTLSKVGDDVTYHFKITNTSSADSPNLLLDGVSDDVLGPLTAPASCDNMAPGAVCEFDVPWTVLAGFGDPVVNTATVHYHPVGFPNDITASDDHSLNLFQPSITFDKTADTELSKVGDDIVYTLTLNNTSSADTPDLTCTVTDATLGINKTVTLASNTGDVTTVTYTVKAGDPDPLPNTASVSCSPDGFPNVLTASGSWTVNLFQPGVTIEKTGDTLSKVGDDVTYHFKITNTSSADSPNLLLDTISDDVLGNLADAAPAACDSIASGDFCEFDVPWTVLAGKGDPVVNTVTVHYHPAGFPNDITASDSHSLNLFQPSITLDKTADTELSKVGDDIVYTLTLNNTSSADTPDLTCTVTDATLGINKTVTLVSGTGDVTTVTYTVQDGDPDPLVNNASASCSPTGFPNVLAATASWTVDLFQPSITFAKTADTELSKVGDIVNYTLTLNNTSTATTPDLNCTIADPMLGVDQQVTLVSGDGYVTNVAYTVKAGDPDPLTNTASARCSPTGFPNVLEKFDSWTVNLFQPGVSIEKTGDTLSKVGDPVTYHFKITNTSSADSPNLLLDSISDDVLGDLSGPAPAACDSIAPGASCEFDVPWTVLAGFGDPVVNTVTVHYHPAGFPNDITATGSHELNLFQPDVTITKTGPAYSKAGDTATYNVTIENTSSADSPNLVLDSFTDSVVAGVTPPAACDDLAPGASCSFSYTYVVQAGDPDPLPNTATAHYHPAGFPNDVTASSTYNTDLLHPTFTVAKSCKAQPVSQAGPAVFRITFNNTGDADLHVVPSEGAPFDVTAGSSFGYDYSVSGPFSATVNNTVTGTVTLDPRYGLANSYDFTASGSCTVYGKAKVVKTVSGQPPAAGQTFTFQLREGASTTSEGTILETRVTGSDGNIDFTTNLVPGQTYQICEEVFPGWNTNLAGDGPLFVPNSLIPPALPNPNVNNLVVCTNFTVTSGQTRTFTVDNTPPPGGRALTIGFWKNWASCTSSALKKVNYLDKTLAMAKVIGDNTDGHFLLPGIVISATSGSFWQFGPTYYLVLHGDPLTPNSAPDCLKAVRLLDKSTITTNKKKASDPAFNMAAQLVAAELNFTAGAGQSGKAIIAVNQAVLLLGKYQFDGQAHTAISNADAATMNCLAGQLDDYNNGRAIRTCPTNP